VQEKEEAFVQREVVEMNTPRKCFLGIMVILIFLGSIRLVVAATERQRQIQKIKGIITYWERFKSDEKLLVPIRVLLEMDPFADPGLSRKERTKKIIRTKCDNRYVRDPDKGTLFGPYPFDRFKNEYYRRRRKEGAPESQIDGEFQTILNKSFELIKYVREKALPRQRDKLSRLERTDDKGKEPVRSINRSQAVQNLHDYIKACYDLACEECRRTGKSTMGIWDNFLALHRHANGVYNMEEVEALEELTREYTFCYTGQVPPPAKTDREGKLMQTQ
jgi:hypothetical protein